MDYDNIARSVDFYRSRGYHKVDAPWYVGMIAYYATRPEGSTDLVLMQIPPGGDEPIMCERPYMVASGEQSFIQMMLDGVHLQRAVCVTPCFRHEARVDRYHRRHFMKCELINAQDVDEGHLIDMIHDACSFFESLRMTVRVVRTGDMSYDILEKHSRSELGSYGIRELTVSGRPDRLRWIYGTGCAEPRTSTVISEDNT